MKVLQNRQRLHRDARHHLLRHDLSVLIPLIPQRRSQKIHDHDVIISLTSLVVHLRHAQNPPQRIIHVPFVRRPVIAPFARSVFKLQRHLRRVRSLRASLRLGFRASADVNLTKATLAEFSLHHVHRGIAHLHLRERERERWIARSSSVIARAVSHRASSARSSSLAPRERFRVLKFTSPIPSSRRARVARSRTCSGTGAVEGSSSAAAA